MGNGAFCVIIKMEEHSLKIVGFRRHKALWCYSWKTCIRAMDESLEKRSNDSDPSVELQIVTTHH